MLSFISCAFSRALYLISGSLHAHIMRVSKEGGSGGPRHLAAGSPRLCSMFTERCFTLVLVVCQARSFFKF